MQQMAEGMKAMALAQEATQRDIATLTERQNRLETVVASQTQPAIEGAAKRTRLQLEYKADMSEEEQLASQPITRKDAHDLTVKLINSAVQHVVGPQVQQLVDTVKTRVETVEQSIHRLHLRVAWVEKDVMYLQTEVAKKQIVMRNWPKLSTEASRWATVKRVLDEAHIWDATVTLTTPIYMADPENGFPEKHLAPVSILTLQSYDDRCKTLKPGKFASARTPQPMQRGSSSSQASRRWSGAWRHRSST